MNDTEREPGDEASEEPELTPSGEPAPDEEDEDTDGTDDDLEGDPVTGSTAEDPNVATTGMPPAGGDPMAGESPSS